MLLVKVRLIAQSRYSKTHLCMPENEKSILHLPDPVVFHLPRGL